MEPVEFLAGPATFLNEAVVQIDEQLERLAKHVPAARLQEYLLAVATKYGITSAPSIDNEEFVATVVFDLSRARGTPKARLSYLFPNDHSAQIVIRLKPDLSEAERQRAIGLIEAAVAETKPRKACEEGGKPAPCFALKGGSYVVSGAPVVVDGLAGALKDALLVLFAVAVVVMAAVLLLAFRSRLRLLPLALALAAVAIAFGLLALVGGSLTMASIAALPILIGLGVDYAIQFQARLDEAEERGLAGVAAARAAAAAGGPTIAVACLATAAGFLALLISPTPMVRSFGLLLVVRHPDRLRAGADGRLRRASKHGRPGSSGRLRRNQRWAPLARGRERVPAPARGPPTRDRTRLPERLVSLAVSRPRTVLAVGVALAIAGWALGTQIETVSDIRKLAPQNIPAVKDLNTLQDTTGVSGELDVSVEAPDLTDPATIEWMAAFKKRVLEGRRLRRRKPELPGSRDLPRAGALGLPRPRQRQADQERDRSDARRALLLRAAPGRAARSEDGEGRPPGAALVRDPGAVAGGPAGADRPRPRPGRHPGRARRAAGGGRRPPRRAAGDRRRRGQRPLRQPLLAQPRRAARGGARPARRLPLALAGAAAAGADRAGDRAGRRWRSGSAASR